MEKRRQRHGVKKFKAPLDCRIGKEKTQELICHTSLILWELKTKECKGDIAFGRRSGETQELSS
jgi:hypothetical protein